MSSKRVSSKAAAGVSSAGISEAVEVPASSTAEVSVRDDVSVSADPPAAAKEVMNKNN